MSLLSSSSLGIPMHPLDVVPCVVFPLGRPFATDCTTASSDGAVPTTEFGPMPLMLMLYELVLSGACSITGMDVVFVWESVLEHVVADSWLFQVVGSGREGNGNVH